MILSLFLLKIDCRHLRAYVNRDLSNNKKNNVSPCYPKLYHVLVGFDGATIS